MESDSSALEELAEGISATLRQVRGIEIQYLTSFEEPRGNNTNL